MHAMRIAFVVQRYGLSVNGGAEHHCRRLAERISRRPEVDGVTVFTTCAFDYLTWENHFAPGVEEIEGVRVERFPVVFPRLLRLQSALAHLTMSGPRLRILETPWLIAQGPFVPDLPRRLSEVRLDYDAFVFFTYLYYPTVYGMPQVADRAVLVPTAHDEPEIRLRCFRRVFELPRAIAFNTPEERDLVRSVLGVEPEPSEIVGCGVDAPSVLARRRQNGAPSRFSRRPYLLYLGRLDGGKGLNELVESFALFKERHADTPIGAQGENLYGRDLRLVLAGRGEGLQTERNDVERAGFVDESLKHDLVAHCQALVVPSRRESLSLALLEGWTFGRPAIVSAHCAVTAGHVSRCGGGFTYANGQEFSQKLAALLANPELAGRSGAAGRRYVEKRYAWTRVEERLLGLLERVGASRALPASDSAPRAPRFDSAPHYSVEALR